MAEDVDNAIVEVEAGKREVGLSVAADVDAAIVEVDAAIVEVEAGIVEVGLSVAVDVDAAIVEVDAAIVEVEAGIVEVGLSETSQRAVHFHPTSTGKSCFFSQSLSIHFPSISIWAQCSPGGLLFGSPDFQLV